MKKKIEKCIEEEFYFEGIYILGSLIENIPKEIMKKNSKKNYNRNELSFANAIEYVKENNIFSKDICNDLNKWRDERNKAVHNLIEELVDEDQLKDIVVSGYNIYLKLEEELKCLE